SGRPGVAPGFNQRPAGCDELCGGDSIDRVRRFLRKTQKRAKNTPRFHGALTSHPKRYSRGIAHFEIAIARKSPQRKEFPVPVVAKIKHARKPSRGVSLLIPKAVRGLRPGEILYPALPGRMANFPDGHYPKQRPGCL